MQNIIEGEKIVKEINKLVRDNIPAIIENGGKKCQIKILDNTEYLEALNAKLMEEVREYLESGEVMELADIEEVIRAILDVKNISYKNFEEIRQEKAEVNGEFKKRIFLIGTNLED